MRNPQDTKNILLLNHYVKNHFGLDKKSKKLFRYRVLYEVNIAPEYREIIKDAPDLRARFKLGIETASFFDKGWSKFKKLFFAFCEKHEVNYSHFYNNKIKIQKNEVKLFKAIFNYYRENCPSELIGNNYNILINFKEKVKQYLEKKYGKIQNFFVGNFQTFSDRVILDISYALPGNNLLLKYYSSKKESNNSFKETTPDHSDYYLNQLRITPKDFLTDEEIDKALKTIITHLFNKIGTETMPKKDLELVLSCNPADMFMASTGEQWGSCLNVDSDYEEAYWAGLPGAIIDKNRAIVYITDGTKKEYRGIVVDKFLSRSWLLTIRVRDLHKSYIQVVKGYPFDVNFSEILRNLTNKKYEFKNANNDNYIKTVSKYKFETLYHDYDDYNKKLCYIYLDTTKIKFAKKGKGKFFPYDYAYHKLGGGYPDILVKTDYSGFTKNSGIVFDEGGGLSNVIDNNYNIFPYEGENDEDDHEDDYDYEDEEAW